MLTKFFDAEKIEVKVGINLSNQKLEKNDVSALSKLPSIESLRAQLLGLLAQPAQQMVFTQCRAAKRTQRAAGESRRRRRKLKFLNGKAWSSSLLTET